MSGKLKGKKLEIFIDNTMDFLCKFSPIVFERGATLISRIENYGLMNS